MTTVILIRVIQVFWCIVGIVAVVSAIAVAMSGCASFPINNESSIDSPQPNLVKQKTEPVFHATMRIQADGKEYAGTASLKRISMGRTIRFYVPRDTYLFSIVTCAGAREIPHPPAGWYDWKYVPVFGLENLESCLTIATAITERGEIYKAIIDYNEGDDLPATVYCNRVKSSLSGAGICQSAAYSQPGLVQLVEFAVPTVWAAKPGCPEPLPSSWIRSTNYEIPIGRGLCVYKFRDQRRRLFRLTTYGYDQVGHVVPGVPR